MANRDLEKTREAHRKWREANHDKHLARRREWEANNRDQARARQRAWRASHPDQLEAQRQRYREKREGDKNREEVLAALGVKNLETV